MVAYQLINPADYTEDLLREMWSKEYCEVEIKTVDGIVVAFYSEMFDHCFFESANRRKKDKSILSTIRLERFYWIKEALQDPDAVLKVGWDSSKKSYDGSRRVALVKGNYVVIIHIYAEQKARFTTAYVVEIEENLEKIMNSPDYKT